MSFGSVHWFWCSRMRSAWSGRWISVRLYGWLDRNEMWDSCLSLSYQSMPQWRSMSGIAISEFVHVCTGMLTLLYVAVSQHTYMSSFYRSSRFGLSHWHPYAVHRGSCLELYYCNTVEWCWWDSSLICKTNWFPSVFWHCWFVHMTCKNCPRYDL